MSRQVTVVARLLLEAARCVLLSTGLGWRRIVSVTARYFTPLLASHAPCSLRTITISPM